jgi:hypothetical protein
LSSKSRLIALVAGVGLWAIAAPTLAAEQEFVLGPDSTITYTVTHPMHHVEGVSHQVSGRVRLAFDGVPELALPVRLAVPIASFQSGNRNRDRNMLMTMNAARFPVADFSFDRATWKTRRGSAPQAEAEGTVSGTLSLHGYRRAIDVPVTGRWMGDRLEVMGEFSVMATEFGIERPQLLMIPIDDRIRLAVHLIGHRR